MSTEQAPATAPVDAVVVPRRFAQLKADSLPSARFGGAWIVQRVTAGWVHLLSADMTATNRLTVDQFNWYCDEFEKAKST